MPSALHQWYTAAWLAETSHNCRLSNRVNKRPGKGALCSSYSSFAQTCNFLHGVAGLCSNMPSLPAGNCFVHVQPALVCVGYELPVFWMETRGETFACFGVVHHVHNHVHIDATGSAVLKVLKLHPTNSCTCTCAHKLMTVIRHINICVWKLGQLITHYISMTCCLKVLSRC